MIKFDLLKNWFTEKNILLVFVIIFIGGLIFNIGNVNTGNVIYDTKIGVRSINEVFDSDSQINLDLEGNITSLKISGEVIGNGTVEVYLGNKLILRSDNFEEYQGIMLTGFVVVDLDNSNLTQIQINEEPSVETIQLNESENENVSKNIEEIIEFTSNTTEELLVQANSTNQTYENVSIIINESVQNLSINESTNNTIVLNETFTKQNISDNVTQDFNEISVQINKTELIINESNISQETIVLVNDTNITWDDSIVINISINESVENISLNISNNVSVNTSYNVSVNTSYNISVNTSYNVSDVLNVSTNISTQFNITSNQTNITNEVIINDSLINYLQVISFMDYCDETCYLPNTPQSISLTIKVNNAILNITTISYKYIEEVKLESLDGYEEFNLSINEKNLLILDSSVDTELFLKIGVDERNYVEFNVNNFSNADIDIIKTNDSRITSKIIRLNKLVKSPKVYLEADDADIVLECSQFNKTCKKWVKTNLIISKNQKSYSFKPKINGIYALSNQNKIRPNYVPTNSVYLNSDCEKCNKIANCNALDFCPLQNKLKDKYDFVAQLDFDVYNLDKINTAQLCAYVTYNTDQNRIHFLKYSPESYCSDIKNGNSTSSIITFATIDKTNDWICVDATQLVEESLERQESNLFINWMGHDLAGGSFPMTCYAGITQLNECGGKNPSGAQDCRPYLKINYK